MKTILPAIFIALLQLHFLTTSAQMYQKGKLLYVDLLSSKEDTSVWQMEGAGQVQFTNGSMQVSSPNEKGYHVFWCPQEFPENFIA